MVLNFNSEKIAVICGNSKEREISLKQDLQFISIEKKNLNVILHELSSFDEQEIFLKNFLLLLLLFMELMVKMEKFSRFK